MTARPQTALAAAMQRAGVNLAKTNLYQLGLDTLRKHRAERDRGFSHFERIVEDDPDLVREALLFYYARLDADMSGVLPTNGDQNFNDTRHSNGEGDQTVPGNQNPRIASLRGGADHNSRDTHLRAVRPVREPSAEERAAAARIANSVAVTVFDSFKVRDGRAIGDVRFGELQRMMTTNAREAAVIRQILEHGDAPHDARVRDLIKSEQLQRMIQRAAEIVDAAK